MTDYLSKPYSTYAQEQAAKEQAKKDRAWKRTMKEAKVHDERRSVARMTKEVAGDQMLARLKALLIELKAAGDKSIASFQERLATNPINAFSWADDAFVGAARIDVAAGILHWIETAKAASDDYSGRSSRDVVAVVRNELTRQVMMEARSPSRSTSACHNITEQARLSVRAKVLEDLDRWSEYLDAATKAEG